MKSTFSAVLSMAAIVAGLFSASVSNAATLMFDMSTSTGTAGSGATLPEGWEGVSIGKADGHANLNGMSDYMYYDFGAPVYSVKIECKASRADATRLLTIIPRRGGNDIPEDAIVLAASTTRDFQEFFFVDWSTGTNPGYTGIKLALSGSGSLGTWVVYSVEAEVNLDPPRFPEISSEGKTAQVGTTFSFPLSVSSFEEDVLAYSVTADKPVAGTYGAANSLFSYTPAEGDDALSPVNFTISVTGKGGTATRSFSCAVVSATAKMPPAVSIPVAETNAMALHRFSLPVTISEPDGDSVVTNVTAAWGGDGRPADINVAIADGVVTCVPSREDISLTPYIITVSATDEDGTASGSFLLYVIPGNPPVIPEIPSNTVYYGSSITNAIVVTPTDGNAIQNVRVLVYPGNVEPSGIHSYNSATGEHIFQPDTSDIGKTFQFTVEATDIDGTSMRDFFVTVALATPALEPVRPDGITEDSFRVTLLKQSPGAEAYMISYRDMAQGEADWTEIRVSASLGFDLGTISGLASSTYECRIRAIAGDVVSDWSEAVVYPVEDFRPEVKAVPLTDRSRRYVQNFNTGTGTGLKETGYWFDARTIPGWYAASGTASLGGALYAKHEGGTDEGCLFSARVDDEDLTNRALGARPQNKDSKFAYGVVFTNTCSYAVTNLTVGFKGMQFRKQSTSKHAFIRFSYAKSPSYFDLSSAETEWTSVPELDFTEMVYVDTVANPKDKPGAVYPVAVTNLAPVSIPFRGADRLMPGETLVLRWYVDAGADTPSLGIDDLEVTWDCAWPKYTIFSIK